MEQKKDIEQVKESICKHEEQVTDNLEKVAGGLNPVDLPRCQKCNRLLTYIDMGNHRCHYCGQEITTG